MVRLLDEYKSKIIPILIKKFNYKNVMQVPKLYKIVINMGVGIASQDRKKIDSPAKELSLISGQKAILTKSKNAIAGFKLREGMPIGCKVTLRGKRMYEFLDRLTVIALPRVKDFRGLKMQSFDGTGNYSLGIKEQIVFPEIDYDKIDAVRGMDITICTTAKSDEESRALLEALNMPFRK